MFSRTKWQAETVKYTGRIAALMLVTPEVEAQLKRFPGLLRKPDDLIAVKHRMLIFANHSEAVVEGRTSLGSGALYSPAVRSLGFIAVRAS